MNSLKPEFSIIAKEDRTPLVDALFEIIVWQNGRCITT
jgi:hypothetical protein